jgi:hypothetical protein
MKMNSHYLVLTLLALAAVIPATAQTDTLAGIRHFLKVCNDYKQLPVQLEVEISKSTNLVLSKEDTGLEKAGFYLEKDGSYIVVGDMEQIANDSLLLVVNKATKRMIVAANSQTVAARLRQMLSMQGKDSTVLQLAGGFLAVESVRSRDTAIIDLKSRTMLLHSVLPREEIKVWYYSRTTKPIKVVTVKRSLLPVSNSVFKEASARAEWVDKTVAVGDSSFFLIKEQQTVFSYRRVMHEASDGLPVRVSDRLVAEGPGKYRPAGSYADYVLSKQF